MIEVPTIRLEVLSEDQIRAYVIADNKLAENAGWDESILAIELQHLLTIENLDFDVTITGFEVPEVDIIIGDQHDERQEDPDDSLPLMTGEPVTEAGDLWQLGKHRILCGDVRSEFSIARLMDNREAALVFTDPPYNVVIDGNVSGQRRCQTRRLRNGNRRDVRGRVHSIPGEQSWYAGAPQR